MKNQIPIKRNKELQPLSREHHYSLLLCWKIRKGFSKSIEIERIKAYSDWFFENSLLSHFNIEEDFLFPFLGKDNDLIKKALTDHYRLKLLFRDDSNIKNSLSLIEEELKKHVRFEERILFIEIEKVASKKELDLIMKIHSEGNSFGDWGDKFWE